MNVVAINASPNMENGTTAGILMPFLEGIKEAGASVELFYTRKLSIHPCQGDFSCWFATPGRCFQKDDMEKLLPWLADADLWVIATPLYVDGMAGTLKNLVDRSIPLLQPFFEIRDGHCRHPLREGARSGKLVLVASCGLWELNNFDPLLTHVTAICRNVKREFSGALLRPHSPALKRMQKKGEPVNDIFEAARSAGSQLVREGCMSDQALATVSRPLMTLETFMKTFNSKFRQRVTNIPERKKEA